MIRVTDTTANTKGTTVFGQDMALGERMALGLVQVRHKRGTEHFFVGVLAKDNTGIGIPMTIAEARALIERMTNILDRHERGEL
jgi:hypothetical protein